MADADTEVLIPEDGAVEIELEGAAPEPKVEAKVTPAPEPKHEPKQTARAVPEDTAAKALQEALDPYKRRAEAAEATAFSERQRAEQAERQRQVREAELQAAQEQIQTGELTRINEGIENAQRLLKSLEAESKAALLAGEFEKVAEIGTKQARAAAALDRYEARKEDFDAGRLKAPVHEGRVLEVPPPAQGSPFERYVSGFAPAAQTWLRAHPECAPTEVGGNAASNAKMMSGHYAALGQGCTPNSEEYFRVIEETAGYRKKAETVAKTEEDTPPPKRETKAVRPSAPPSRDPPGSPQTGSMRTVRLSKDEQDMARVSFPHMKSDQERFAEYARNKLELEAEGKLGRTTH